MTTPKCPVALPAPGTLITVKAHSETDPRRKVALENHAWVFVGAELDADGRWYANLTREEPNSLDDVYNGTGTGLGSTTVTMRTNITD